VGREGEKGIFGMRAGEGEYDSGARRVREDAAMGCYWYDITVPFGLGRIV